MATNMVTPKTGLTVAAEVTAREVDFVTRFANNWEHLREIMGVMRMINKAPGTVLKSKYATVALENGNVEAGAEIPYSEAQVHEKEYGTIRLEKFAKGVPIELIDEVGYENAIGLTDDQFLYELQALVVGRFYDYLKTGELISAKPTFQEALAEGQGRVRNKFKGMNKGITEIVGFCNLLDAYDYLGAANITVQNEFGLNYIENFLGYRRLFLASDNEIPRGKVVSLPVENIIGYKVSPDDNEFSRAGLSYTVDGVTNIIGVHTQGNYGTAVSEMFAFMGLVVIAEYIDGVAVVDIGVATFTAVETPSADDMGDYFEQNALGDYVKTADTTPVTGKTYYTREVTKAA